MLIKGRCAYFLQKRIFSLSQLGQLLAAPSFVWCSLDERLQSYTGCIFFLVT